MAHQWPTLSRFRNKAVQFVSHVACVVYSNSLFNIAGLSACIDNCETILKQVHLHFNVGSKPHTGHNIYHIHQVFINLSKLRCRKLEKTVPDQATLNPRLVAYKSSTLLTDNHLKCLSTGC